jgi:hypothetical protein
MDLLVGPNLPWKARRQDVCLQASRLNIIGTIQGHHITTPHATKHPKFCGQNVHTTSAVEHQNRYLNTYNKRLGVSC